LRRSIGGASGGESVAGEVPSHMGTRAGDTGIMMREWMTWVSGAAIGAGEVGGSDANARMSGGRSLVRGESPE